MSPSTKFRVGGGGGLHRGYWRLVSKGNWGQIKKAVDVRLRKLYTVRKLYTHIFGTHYIMCENPVGPTSFDLSL